MQGISGYIKRPCIPACKWKKSVYISLSLKCCVKKTKIEEMCKNEQEVSKNVDCDVFVNEKGMYYIY